MDIKCLPQMADETHRRYLLVAIDRATRWVYFRTCRNQSWASSTDFLRRLKRIAPMVIKTLLTDNASQFTDRLTGVGKQASGEHVFDLTSSTPTTTAYRNALWNTEVRFRHSKHGGRKSPNCLSNEFMNRRNLTPRQEQASLERLAAG